MSLAGTFSIRMFLFRCDSLFVVFVISITLEAHNVGCNPVPVRNPMENPKLFGGDMVGISKRLNQRYVTDLMRTKWPHGVIPFIIDRSLETYRKLIYNAMNEFHQQSCVRFVHRSAEYDYIYITKQTGCHSHVGRIGGKQILSLGDGCYNRGTVIHELGHAVGFFHEHQRTDRNKHIDIHFDNLRENTKESFKMMMINENTSEYDYDSIMHYGSHSFAKLDASRPSLITITKKGQMQDGLIKEVSEKNGFSELDKVALNKMYEC